MRRLILKMSISVDGFVAGPEGRLDWIFDTMDDGVTAWTLDDLRQAGVHIMGSRTFHDMAAYWPTSGEPFAAPMNAIPKVVFSRTGDTGPKTTRGLDDARSRATAPQVTPQRDSWTSARWAVGDLAQEIAKLKAEDGKPIIAYGGASFARSLVALDAIDEYRLLVHPIALGRGLPLFTDLAAPRPLRLTSAQAFAAGAVAHVYTRS